MARKRTLGLIKRGNTWHMDKIVGGRRIRGSTGTSEVTEAERFLTHKLEEIRQAEVYGVRPKRTFRQAATKYLKGADKASLRYDAIQLKLLDPFIGNLPLEAVHMGTLQPFIEARKAQKRKKRTINYGLQVVRHILNLAASEWMDEHGMTWLAQAPKIKLLREDDKKKPSLLSHGEQGGYFVNCLIIWQ